MTDQFVGLTLANRLRYLLAALVITTADTLTVVCLAVVNHMRTAFSATPAGELGQAQAVVTLAETAQGRGVARPIERPKSVGEAYSQQVHHVAITRATASKGLSVTEAPNARFGFYRLFEGKTPRLTNGIAINQTTAQQMRLRAGNTMTMTVCCKTPDSSGSQSFPIGIWVTGVYKKLYRVARGGHLFAGYITPEAAKEWCNRGGYPPADAETTVYAISATGHSDAEVLIDLFTIPGASVESRSGEGERGLDEGLSRANLGATATALAAALFALNLAGTVAWNAFRAAGASRRRQLTFPATLEASSRRMRKTIAWEAVTVDAVASAIGVTVGMSSTKFVPRPALGDPASAVLPAGIRVNPFYGFFAFITGSFVAVSVAVPFVFRSREVAPLETVSDSLAAAPGDGKTIRSTVVFDLVGVGVVVTFTGVFFSNPGDSEGSLPVVIGASALFRGIAELTPSVARRLGIPLADFFLGSLGSRRSRVRLTLHDMREQGIRGKLARVIMATLFTSTSLPLSAAVTIGVTHVDAPAAIDTLFPRDVDMRQTIDSGDVELRITASQEKVATAGPNVTVIVPVYETKADSDFGKLTLPTVDPIRTLSALRDDSRATYERAGTVASPEHIRTAKMAKRATAVTERDSKRLGLSVVFGGVVSPTVSLKDLRRLGGVEVPAALQLRTRGDKPMVERVRPITHDINETSGDMLAKATSSLLYQRSVYSAVIDLITRLLDRVLVGLAVASGPGASFAIAPSLSTRRRDFEILRVIDTSGRSIRRTGASCQCALAPAGTILGAFLDILVSSDVDATFLSCTGGVVEGTLPPLSLVYVLPAEATTIGTANYFTLRTLTGRHLAQSTRLMDHKSNP